MYVRLHRIPSGHERRLASNLKFIELSLNCFEKRLWLHESLDNDEPTVKTSGWDKGSGVRHSNDDLPVSEIEGLASKNKDIPDPVGWQSQHKPATLGDRQLPLPDELSIDRMYPDLIITVDFWQDSRNR